MLYKTVIYLYKPAVIFDGRNDNVLHISISVVVHEGELYPTIQLQMLLIQSEFC